mmetsp:Transcript_48480/g.156602  ORF Transcript_48480/g.156602 Transcript_48480/m.156602 type:complete len:419 (-) Transcript_48480:48-1304(-)
MEQCADLLLFGDLATLLQGQLQSLSGLADASVAHEVRDLVRAVPSQPGGHLRLDFVHEDLVAKLQGLVRHHADVDAVQQGVNGLALPLGYLLDLFVGADRKLLAGLLEGACGLLIEALVVRAVRVDRILPLAVDEEVADLVENVAVRLQHVGLHQELLLLRVVPLVLKERLEVVDEILRLAVDHALAEKGQVGWLHEKLVPTLRLDLLEHGLGVEAVVDEDRGDHRDACLDALLHVAGLVQDPLVVVPLGVVPCVVAILLDPHDGLPEGNLAIRNGDAHVAPEVKGQVVLGQALRVNIIHFHEIDLEDVWLQASNLEAGGHIGHILAAPPGRGGAAIVFDLEFLGVVPVVGADLHGVEDLAVDDADPDLAQALRHRNLFLGDARGCRAGGLHHCVLLHSRRLLHGDLHSLRHLLRVSV